MKATISSQKIYLSTANSSSSRRVKWIIWGTLAGITPFLTLSLADHWLNKSGNSVAVANFGFRLLNWFVHAAILFVPLIWGYAILKQQLPDVSIIARRLIRFSLSRMVLYTAFALPLIAILYAAATNPERPLKEIILGNPLLLALIPIIALSIYFQPVLLNKLERLLFRKEYAKEQILFTLENEIRGLNNLVSIIRRTNQLLNLTILPQQIYWFFRLPDSRELALSYSSNSLGKDIRIPEKSEIRRWLRHLHNAEEWSPLISSHISEEEQEWINELQGHLFIPIIGTGKRLEGLIILGKKLSQQTYTLTERTSLFSIARQIALTCERQSVKALTEAESKNKLAELSRLEAEQTNLNDETENHHANNQFLVQEYLNDLPQRQEFPARDRQ